MPLVLHFAEFWVRRGHVATVLRWDLGTSRLRFYLARLQFVPMLEKRQRGAANRAEAPDQTTSSYEMSEPAGCRRIGSEI